MIDNNFNVQEYKGGFGVETDVQGNLLTPTISIGGIDVSEDFLKDCLLMACSCAAENQGIKEKNVRAFLVDALTIYHTLDGLDVEDATETAETALLIMEHDHRRNCIEQEESIEDAVIKAYFDYYGKNASIPSFHSTEVTPKYIRLYNSNGLLATYNRKTGEFTPKYE